MSSEVNLNVETSEVVPGLRRGVEVAPDDANAHLLLGTALAEAVEAYGRALELRGRLRRSPLMDHAGYARELTEALEGLVTA